MEFSGLVHVSNPRASGSQAVGFSALAGKPRLPSLLPHSKPHTHTRFTISQLRARGRHFAQLRCSLSREQSVQGVPRYSLPGGAGGRSVLQLLEPRPQTAPPPLAAVCQHLLLLPRRGFPLLSLLNPLAYNFA